MGANAADFKRRRAPRLFVAPDAMENCVYRNEGNGKCTEIALQAGVAFSANGDYARP